MNELVADAASADATLSHPAEQEKPETSLFFRRKGNAAGIAAILFGMGLLGALLLLVIFHWPEANVVVYYFVTRPGFVWFGMLLPLFAPALLYLKPRWLLAGAAIWFLALCACDDGYKIIRPGAERHRESFEAARHAHWSFMANDGPKELTEIQVPLRVLTWNVRNGTLGARELAAEIAAQRADLVVLQEFAWGTDPTMQLAILATPELAAYEFKPDYKFAILSRFPLEKVKSEYLPPYNHSVWDIEVLPGHKLCFIIAHLPPQDLKTQILRGWTVAGLRDAVLRNRRTLQALEAAVIASPQPLIIAGDFNLPRQYPELRTAMSGLKECFADEGYGWGKTAPAKLPAVRADMIYVPENAEVTYSATIPTSHSDHCGMLAEFVLPPFQP
jgi:endonuclease/exonuclease/phosphatase (EEP) superfamily protein YafD